MRPTSLEASILTPAGSRENPLLEVRMAADAAPAPSMKPRRVKDFDISTSQGRQVYTLAGGMFHMTRSERTSRKYWRRKLSSAKRFSPKARTQFDLPLAGRYLY